MADDETASVRVALRIRPQLAKERIDNCRICTSVTPREPQVVLGNDKAFTFDDVFDVNATQDQVFACCAKSLIEGCLEGFNATILAYGQTGSGKTYSMGTGFGIDCSPDQVGIIPRAVKHLFDGITYRKTCAISKGLPEPTFLVNAQFMELYNEDIYDLFDQSDGRRTQKSSIRIHEDSGGGIYVQGVTDKLVQSYDETMECLRAGALSRTTASTNMNSQSSRSHAIFTLHIQQSRLAQEEINNGDQEWESLTAKFHFVDLAGSERLKRTGATGDRAKEGISINCGLLALGNVISALGDITKKGSHVPYRDSKLTRLLQDSLGGNSRTVMIACISPSDRDFMETLNTLKYANRARNIKNRVVVNQDKSSKQLTEMRALIQALQLELMEYKQGKRIVSPDGVESINDMFHENTLLQLENDKLRQRVKALQETVDSLTARNSSLVNERAAVILSVASGDNINEEVQKLIAGYTTEMEMLRAKLFESEAAINSASRAAAKTPPTKMPWSAGHQGTPRTPDNGKGISSILELAKLELEKDRELLVTRQSSVISTNGVEKIQDSGGSAGDDSGEHEDMGERSEDEEGGSDADIDGALELDDMLVDLSSESDSDQDSDHIQEDLADLTCEISIKQKMIEELEKSQRQLQTIRQHYEDKLRNLQEQIQAVERERDQVLNSLGDKKQQSEEQVRKIKTEYEKRLSDMMQELGKVNAAKKEHAKMMKNQAVYDKQIKQLSTDLNEMKKIKVRLMAQMKSESEKNKLSDQKKSKELVQLRKEKRLRDNQIKALELQNRQKEAILKRKHEEVSLLRRKQRGDNSSSQRILLKNQINNTHNASRQQVVAFSPKEAKSKWDKLEHYITSVVMRKQTIALMEAEMDLHIAKREKLSKNIEHYSYKLEDALSRNEMELAVDIEDQLETMNTNINYVQSTIEECQNSIIQMEGEAKDESVLDSVLSSITLEESTYLLEHLLSMALAKGFLFMQKDAAYKELGARYEKLCMDSKLRDQLLQQVLQDAGVVFPESADREGTDSTTCESGSGQSSPTHLDSEASQLWAAVAARQAEKKRKARRRTATPSELLFAAPKGMCIPNSTLSPLSSPPNKPPINLTDILPPAPRAPPPGRGAPIDTIAEEDEDVEALHHEETPKPEDAAGRLVRSDSYTILTCSSLEKPHIVSTATNEEPNSVTSSGSTTPDYEFSIDSNLPLSGSYSLTSGEIKIERITGSSGDPGAADVNTLKIKRIPPKVPPKPLVRSTSLGSGTGMAKWKGVSSSHLDSDASNEPNTTLKLAEAKHPVVPTTSDSKQSASSEKTGRVLGRRTLSGPGGSSPALRRKTFQSSSAVNNKERVPVVSEVTPPSSPSLRRRGLPADSDSNVFMRLTNGSASLAGSKRPNAPGDIIECDKVLSNTQAMTSLKKAVGHSKAVLCICATEELLISGSKDQTCKIWDLSTGCEILSLDDHPNYVTRVRYCDKNKLVYSVSNSFVKVWDIRSRAKCIKVLSSSGLVHESIPIEPSSNCQAILQQGENHIHDIALRADGHSLYTTTSNTVRVWDLRLFSAVSKVASSHQGPITCLSIHCGQQCLVTGSKDHSIKLFDLPSDGPLTSIIQARSTLDPPHYDGVQCLAHRGTNLFSGSRDMCIKKWDLNEQCLLQSLNGAHRDWIQDLCLLPDNDILISCCRLGVVKLWSTEGPCPLLDEVKAHSVSVNSLAINSNLCFTASSDCTVGVWSIDSRRLASSQS